VGIIVLAVVASSSMIWMAYQREQRISLNSSAQEPDNPNFRWMSRRRRLTSISVVTYDMKNHDEAVN
jgi:hypothetical protein